MSTPVLLETDAIPAPRGRLMRVRVKVVIGPQFANVYVLNLNGDIVGRSLLNTTDPDGTPTPAERLAQKIAATIEQIVINNLHLKERNRPVQAISIAHYDTSADGPWPPDCAKSATNVIRTKLWDICSCNNELRRPDVSLVPFPDA